MRYNVFADHPTFQRIDKYNLTEAEKDNLVKELKLWRYENIKIKKIEKKC